MPSCKMTSIGFDYFDTSNKIIPINTRNFWVYADSIWNINDTQLFSVKSTLIKIGNVYSLNDGLYSFDFTSNMPPLMAQNDTLYTISLSDFNTSSICYILKPYLFSVSDRVKVEDNVIIYKSIDTLYTIAGSFSNNIIRNESNILEIIMNSKIGIIKITYFKADSSGRRRTLTLKDYYIE